MNLLWILTTFPSHLFWCWGQLRWAISRGFSMMLKSSHFWKQWWFTWFCKHLLYFTEVKMPTMVSLRKKKATIKKLKFFNSEDFYSTLWKKDSDLFGQLSKICVLKNTYRSCPYIKMQIWALSICCYSWNNLIFRILLLWIIFLHLEAPVSVFFHPSALVTDHFLKECSVINSCLFPSNLLTTALPFWLELILILCQLIFYYILKEYLNGLWGFAVVQVGHWE